MSTTQLINQAVLEQRHASDQQQQLRSSQQRSAARSNAGQRSQNVGSGERQMSLLGGAVLAGLGLTRGGMTGLLMLGVGGALAYRGATGYCSMYDAMGVDTSKAN